MEPDAVGGRHGGDLPAGRKLNVPEEQFHFADFTRHNYRRLLRLAKSKYPFTTYPAADFSRRFVLWRHDVDMSIHASLKLAEIEAAEGVPATYFVNPHCHYYNLFEPEVRDRVVRIGELGHAIGLHIDHNFHRVTTVAELETALAIERRWLEEVFKVPIEAFSFHDPGPFTETCRADRYAGMINCYAGRFQQGVGYCSDSNGYWRHRRLEDVLQAAADERLQVLTHPEWWQDTAMSPRQRVQHCINGRTAYLERRYDDGMKIVNRRNVSDE